MPKSGSRGPKSRAKSTSDLVAMVFDASRSGWAGADTLCDGSGLGGGWILNLLSERGKRFDCWLRSHKPALESAATEGKTWPVPPSSPGRDRARAP